MTLVMMSARYIMSCNIYLHKSVNFRLKLFLFRNVKKETSDFSCYGFSLIYLFRQKLISVFNTMINFQSHEKDNDINLHYLKHKKKRYLIFIGGFPSFEVSTFILFLVKPKCI